MIEGLSSWIEQLLRGDLPSERDIRKICESASSMLVKEPNLLDLRSPVNVCGDIHGQYTDLLELLQVGGRLGEYQYLFLGDFVDRGSYSIETILLLLVSKLKHPERIWLLRGNHESRHVTLVYGFYDECLRKFGSPNVWKLFSDVFDKLPLAALIDSQIFCVHGGLSPSVSSLDHVKELNRYHEIPNDGPLCDMVWSDPQDVDGWSVSSRGAGYLFGPDIVKRFLHSNSLRLITRSHQLVMEGYRWYFEKKLLTVWSAPNYCSRCGNTASIFTVDEHLSYNFAIFEHSNHFPVSQSFLSPYFN